MFKSKSLDSFLLDVKSRSNSASEVSFTEMNILASQLNPYHLESTIKLLKRELVEIQELCDELMRENEAQRGQIANLTVEMAEMSDQIQSQEREDSILLKQELTRLKKLQLVMQQKLKRSELRNERAERDRSRLELKLTKLISTMAQITQNASEFDVQKLPEAIVEPMQIGNGDDRAYQYDSTSESDSSVEGNYEANSCETTKTPKHIVICTADITPNQPNSNVEDVNIKQIIDDLERYNFERLRQVLEESFARESDLRCKLRLSEQQLELISDQLKQTRQIPPQPAKIHSQHRHTVHWNDNLNIHMPKTNESFDQLIKELKSNVVNDKTAQQNRLGSLSKLYDIPIEPQVKQQQKQQENNESSEKAVEKVPITVDPIHGVLLKRKPISVHVEPDILSNGIVTERSNDFGVPNDHRSINDQRRSTVSLQRKSHSTNSLNKLFKVFKKESIDRVVRTRHLTVDSCGSKTQCSMPECSKWQKLKKQVVDAFVFEAEQMSTYLF